jgi:thiol-disulfide isomerase/thioredoxin
MNVFNHYSVLIIGALLLVIGATAVIRRGGKLRGWLVLAGVMGLYVAAWYALRPVTKPAMQVAGKALLIEIQSPYCLGCVAMKPAVDHLENELRDRLVVRRVDIRSDEGRQLMKEYEVEFTPTFIVFDVAGKERWRRTGTLDAEAVRDAIR